VSVKNGRKRVVIEILGEEYIIRSTSSHHHVLEVGKYVDRMLKELWEKYPRMSLQKIAILAALNLASELLPLQKRGKKGKR
jgi:cell division protein ZapA